MLDIEVLEKILGKAQQQSYFRNGKIIITPHRLKKIINYNAGKKAQKEVLNELKCQEKIKYISNSKILLVTFSKQNLNNQVPPLSIK